MIKILSLILAIMILVVVEYLYRCEHIFLNFLSLQKIKLYEKNKLFKNKINKQKSTLYMYLYTIKHILNLFVIWTLLIMIM